MKESFIEKIVALKMAKIESGIENYAARCSCPPHPCCSCPPPPSC